MQGSVFFRSIRRLSAKKRDRPSVYILLNGRTFSAVLIILGIYSFSELCLLVTPPGYTLGLCLGEGLWGWLEQAVTTRVGSVSSFLQVATPSSTLALCLGDGLWGWLEQAVTTRVGSCFKFYTRDTVHGQ